MKRGPFLIDTGFVVALVNSADPAHRACVDVWRQVQGPFVSTEGVLVEAGWLLRKEAAAFPRAWSMLRSVGTRLLPSIPWRYEKALELMEAYRDVPMDLVDALLVAITEETGIVDVLTLDRRGFSAYRVGTKAFKLWP